MKECMRSHVAGDFSKDGSLILSTIKELLFRRDLLG